jgi:hypothetical protein
MISFVYSGFLFDFAQGGELVEPRISFTSGELVRIDGFEVS